MDINSKVNEDWVIILEGFKPQVTCERKDFFIEPSLGNYARYAFEYQTGEWVEDTVNPSDMFELKSVDEQAHRATFIIKESAMDFAGENINFGGNDFKLQKDWILKPNLPSS